MNSFAAFVVIVFLLMLGTAEGYLLYTYWSVIMKVANFDKVGPLIGNLFTPLVAAITVLLFGHQYAV